MGQTASAPRLDSTLSMLLVIAGRTMQQRLEAELAGVGLTMRHLGALGHLTHQPELSYSDLARRSRVTSQSMHATVRQLEELGAVQRRTGGQGRPARLEVTESGQRMLEAARQAAYALDAELLKDLSAEQRRLLSETITGLLGRMLSGSTPTVMMDR